MILTPMSAAPGQTPTQNDAPFHYVGDELELFAQAKHWKAYLRARIAPWIGPSAEVLEVGAGIGGTTRVLCPSDARRWIGLEPDPRLAEQLGSAIAQGALPAFCEARVGTLADLGPDERFDAILYIDVLEHIERDRDEVQAAADRLKPGGRLIVLAPAHQWLFTPFDRAIGHYRRYSKSSLKRLTPEGLRLAELRYLDSAGLLASTANRILLRQAMPTPRQIAVWDRILVRASRVLDPLTAGALGKSVLAVWRREATPKLPRPYLQKINKHKCD